MLVKINCARCQGLLMLNEEHVGRLVRCPTCRNTFTANAPELDVEEEPVQPALELIDPDPAPAAVEDPVAIQLELEAPAPRPRPTESLRLEPSRRPVSRRRSGARFRFPVRVLDDSSGELEGSMEAVANGDGLELREGRRRLLFAPVGTPTTYAGHNELEVVVDQRRVRLAVTKRVRSQRLAQDLVDFLNDERNPLNADHYQVPRVLLIAALGLPLAAVLVVGVVLLIRLLTTVPRIDESAWKELKPAGARCRLLMPGTAVTRQQHHPALKQPMTVYVVEVKRPNSAFFFCHFPLPREEIGRMPLNDRFEGARLGMLANTPGATFISQRDIKLDRHPGREYVLDVQKKGKMTVRIYCVDERELYMLLAGGDNFEPNTPDVVKFFDSFKLLNR